MSSKQLVLYPTTQAQRADLPLVSDVQFMDKFASTAMNTKFSGVFGAGVYRGFEVVSQSGGRVKVAGSANGDTAVVNLANNICLTINAQKSILVDVPADGVYTLVLNGFYEYGVTTTQVDTESKTPPATLELIAFGTETDEQVVLADVEWGGSGAVAVDYLRRQYGSPVNSYSSDYLDDALLFKSESEFNAMREANRQKFAASDFISHGQHYASNSSFPVNEGLYGRADVASPNTLWLGRAINGSGFSKEEYPLFNLNGITCNFERGSGGYSQPSVPIFLPPPPNGTVTYDSATGVITDFTKDIDPKYGNVASKEKEAAHRAFEGEFDGVNLSTSNFYGVVAESNSDRIIKMTVTNNTSVPRMDILSSKFGAGEYIVEVQAVSLGFTVYFSGSSAGSASKNVREGESVSLKWGGDVNVQVRVRNSDASLVAENGDIAEVRVSVRKVTNQVVTERVDLAGFEFYLEEINDGEVFPLRIQSKNSNIIDGIPMVLSKRPKSYFQFYDGQYEEGMVNDEFRCWYWPDLTSLQKAQVASYLGDTLFINEAGNKVQCRIRARSFAGAGNGDWGGSDMNSQSSSRWFKFSPSSTNYSRVAAQGHQSSSPAYNDVSTFFNYCPVNSQYISDYWDRKDVSNGIFHLYRRDRTDVAFNGECYFYMVATVPRLNSGAYHPILNPKGTAQVWNKTHTNNTSWDNASSMKLASKLDCFRFGEGLDLLSTVQSKWSEFESGETSRYDGKSSDVTYHSGMGGAVDHRLKFGAWDASSSDKAAIVKESLKSGEYRGQEMLKRTEIWQLDTSSSTTFDEAAKKVSSYNLTNNRIELGSNSGILADSRLRVFKISTGEVFQFKVKAIATDNSTWQNESGTDNFNTLGLDGNCYLFIEFSNNITVEGEFQYMEIVGHPSNILDIPLLSNGWIGAWSPDFNFTDNSVHKLVRKSLGNVTMLTTSDGGQSWVNESEVTTDNVLNAWSVPAQDANLVGVLLYNVFAKQTKKSANASLLNGNSGIVDFCAFNFCEPRRGGLLFDTLLGKANNATSNPSHSSYSLLNYSIRENGSLDVVASYQPTHIGLKLANATSEGSPALKALFHQIDENGQANLNIIANEIVYDAESGSWGDDEEVKVIASGSFTDDNGKYCLSDIHKLSKPYGWIKNEI